MTTDDLPPGQPAATHRLPRRVSRLLISLGLCAMASVVQAQTAPADVDAASTPASADVVTVPAAPASKSVTASVKEKAAEAATATLSALLPRLAASDTLPLVDRSAMVAGDISKLLAAYDLSKEGVVAQEQQGGKVQVVLQRALALMGTPYRWGGTSPDSGFDCSGLVGYVFRTALGIELPRVSRDMAANADAERIGTREELRQGDLVFFGLKGRVNHVGIYVGEGRFLHSPSSGKDVRVDSLITGYWANRYLSARRVAM
ncbi:C40 family peptidase [Pseudoxanthomonas sp. PXM02]|uniref:NlpC/P60 family protein n=1 Tax=Pseudoxanthomonas sp. PXM02 TaxID=2769294 RepID=UPI0017811449|nr:C40 family peptidase [Pseudoxanthomonas sp. PXM02]